MGNYASKDGSEEASNIHDSNAIPSRNTNGGVALRPFRAEEQTQRVAPDEQALVLEGDMDNSVRLEKYHIRNISCLNCQILS